MNNGLEKQSILPSEAGRKMDAAIAKLDKPGNDATAGRKIDAAIKKLDKPDNDVAAGRKTDPQVAKLGHSDNDVTTGRKSDPAIDPLGHSGNDVTVPGRRGHLIFGLDLTSSREASLHGARIATAAMFDALRMIGSIAIKLIYYRGSSECRAGAWQDDPAVVSRSMRGLSCETGYSQIVRILRFALAEREHLDGVVFIGDQCEEEAGELERLAAALGKQSIPLFVFHECGDSDDRSQSAKPLFKRLAEISGGVYCEFKPTSASVLRELLSTVGAFSVASHEGVKQVGPAATPEAQQLQKRLLLLPAGAAVPAWQKRDD